MDFCPEASIRLVAQPNRSVDGPGFQHVAGPSQAKIVNPARLDNVRVTDVCMQCHSEGRPVNNSINGKYWGWAVGFDVGKDLKDFWKLEEFKLGERSLRIIRACFAREGRAELQMKYARSPEQCECLRLAYGDLMSRRSRVLPR